MTTSNEIPTMKFVIGDKAKKLVHTFRKGGNLSDYEIKLCTDWAREENVVCAYLTLKDEIVSFSVLHRMDVDPFGCQEKPHLLHFIYTFPQYRGRHYASYLLEEIAKKFETTSVCSNKKSFNAHIRASYTPVDVSDLLDPNGNVVMRSLDRKLLNMLSSGKSPIGTAY